MPTEDGTLPYKLAAFAEYLAWDFDEELGVCSGYVHYKTNRQPPKEPQGSWIKVTLAEGRKRKYTDYTFGTLKETVRPEVLDQETLDLIKERDEYIQNAQNIADKEAYRRGCEKKRKAGEDYKFRALKKKQQKLELKQKLLDGIAPTILASMAEVEDINKNSSSS